MVTYTVDVPLMAPRNAIYETWQDREVASRILAYNSTNPLGVSTYLHWIVVIYFPLLIIFAGSLNVFALCVIRSCFLRCLVIQPMIRALLQVQTLLLFVGPFYTWFVQYFHFYLSRHQLYPCFLVIWAHNFAVLATSTILVAMIVERALSMGRPEVLWGVLQKACRNIINILLVAALVMGVGGLMCVDGAMEYHRIAYPACLPWWSNEHGLVNPVWYKILACCFTLAPSFLIMFSVALLASSVNRFKQMIRASVGAFNHYNALYLVVRSRLHVKFVHSVLWLGSLFVMASSPLGCFIIFGPAIYYKMNSHGNSLSPTANKLDHTITSIDDFSKMQNKSDTTKDTKVVNYPGLAPFDYSYLLVSRSDAETIMWILYYSFTLCIVPVMLATEVLFRREWKELCKTVIRRLLRRNHCSRWSACDVTECDNGDFIGPYVAKSDGQSSTKGGVEVLQKIDNFKLYDAGKAERAGRRLDIGNLVSF